LSEIVDYYFDTRCLLVCSLNVEMVEAGTRSSKLTLTAEYSRVRVTSSHVMGTYKNSTKLAGKKNSRI